MEQRFKEDTRTMTKQYGPKVEALLSAFLLVASSAALLIASLV